MKEEASTITVVVDTTEAEILVADTTIETAAEDTNPKTLIITQKPFDASSGFFLLITKVDFLASKMYF